MLTSRDSIIVKKSEHSLFVLFLLLCCIIVSQATAFSAVPEGKIVIGKITLSGNVITRPYILYRELVFAEGDTLATEEFAAFLADSRKNLLNTALFNFVNIDTSRTQSGSPQIDIRINVIERWYIWPAPILEITDRNLNAWWSSRDFTRINYGFSTVWSNFRGKMETLNLLLRFGKNHEYSLMYDIPYVDKGKRFGAGFGGGVMKNREVAFDTRSDKLEFLFSREYPVEQWFTSFHFSFRPKYHTTYLVDFRVQSVSFSDTLLRLNPLFSYRGKSSLTFLNFYYKVKIDYRDTKYYPLDGWYADLEFNKAGLGLRFEGPVNLFWMKSTLRFFLPVSGRWYAGAGAIARISSPGSQPYFFKQGMGYVRDFVRGYEYYVIEGQQYAIFKSTIKFALVPEFSTEIRFIPTEKFSRIHFASYLTAFADAGCTWKQSGTPASGNVLPGTLLLSGGLGLDFVTYYDKVLRIEYAVNKKGESGIFIHLIAGI